MLGTVGQGMEMGSRVRLASLALVFALVAACTGQAASSAAAPASSTQSAAIAARASASPCAVGLTLLEAFTQRLADDLASLRPLATAVNFDSAKTVDAIRRVSATMTTFAGLDESLQACDLTGDLAKQVEALTASVEDAVTGSLSVSIKAAQAQRDAGVALFALLPQVLTVSEDGQAIADDLALGLAVAHVPDGATNPIGSLAPLPTPTPRPTPRPTARPKPKPTAVAGSGASSGSGWTSAAKITATAYKTDAYATYDSAVREANYEMAVAGFQDPGLTAAERSARVAAAKMQAAYNLMLVINSHFGFMNSNRPAACFADAYAADIKVGNAIWAAAKYMLDNQGSGDLARNRVGPSDLPQASRRLLFRLPVDPAAQGYSSATIASCTATIAAIRAGTPPNGRNQRPRRKGPCSYGVIRAERRPTPRESSRNMPEDWQVGGICR